MKIVDLCRIKNLRMALFKVKSHSKNKWNNRADALAKKGMSSKKIIYTKEIRCKEIEFCLEWGNKRIDIPAQLLCKLIINARVGAEWRETRAIKSLEPETETTSYNWAYFWKIMNTSKGVRYNTRRISARRSALIKCIMEKLPTLEELNKRRPDIYTMAECQVCLDKIKETQSHLASCKGQTSLWKRIQKVTIAIAWKGLEEEERLRVPPYILYTALYGKSESEEVATREALIKGLIPEDTHTRLTHLLKTKSRKKFVSTVLRTAWNTFYEQVWRIRCGKVNEWEKEKKITGKMKRRIKERKKPVADRRPNQQWREEKRRQLEEKEECVKKKQ